MIEELIKLAALKDRIDTKRAEQKYFEDDWIIGELLSEIQEVKEEIRPDNQAFLEDELGDILWGWLILVQKLKSKGFVSSHEAIIRRALKKYSQRIGALKGDENDDQRWVEVKAEQKEVLEAEQGSMVR